MALFTYFELKEFDSASLTGSFQNFGSALSRPCYECEITNASDVDVYITTDGSTNELRIAAGTTLDITGATKFNSMTEGVVLFKQGTQLQIRQVTGAGSGSIFSNILTQGTA